MRILLMIFLAFPALSAAAQGVVVSGRLVDEHQQPVPYASVALADGRTGTVSNEVGEFSLRLPALPQQLTVLSIGYERAVIAVTRAGPLPAAVVLRASAVQLPEVTVRANAEAEALVQRCYAKLLRHQNDVQYGRAFYRQTTREDGRYRELFDAFYDVKITPRNQPSWVLGEARYAFTPGVMSMNNFSIYTRLLPLFVLPAAGVKTAVPLGPDAAQRFSFVLRQTLSDHGHDLAVVDFAPRTASDKVAHGTLYIDPRTAALFRVDKEMPTKGLFASNSPTLEIKGSSLRIVTTFGAQDDSLTRVVNTQVVGTVRLTLKGVAHESTTSSHCHVYEFGPPSPGQKYRVTDQSQNDLSAIKKRRYNPQFWRANAVVKDSPVEEQIIRDFEGRKVFGKLN